MLKVFIYKQKKSPVGNGLLRLSYTMS